MGKSVAIDAKPKTSKTRGMSIESALMAFAEEANLYNGAKTFLEQGLGIALWSNNPGTPQNDISRALAIPLNI